MNKLLIIFLLISNLLHAQTDNKFLADFLLGNELKAENTLDKFSEYDFSNIWTKTDNQFVYGIIGTEHQRIRIKLISVEKNSLKPNEYIVLGKSKVKETICDFQGIIEISEIKELKMLNYGVDNEYEDIGIKAQGIIIASYEFRENKEQKHSGTFTGQLLSKWYLDSKDSINYDNIESFADSYSNNAFIGIWKSYNTEHEKLCNWADYRVPGANEDFDIGAGEFCVAEKYWSKGWLDIALINQVPNHAIKRSEKTQDIKNWWE
ncbi:MULTISPECIES: hypothetical protein [unclassified Carboxylicivirga]|uniref:hypothetical protein n=1 Tax=Carboxylicivirga TaxID=1628153 RepID=UPI003D340C84